MKMIPTSDPRCGTRRRLITTATLVPVLATALAGCAPAPDPYGSICTPSPVALISTREQDLRRSDAPIVVVHVAQDVRIEIPADHAFATLESRAVRIPVAAEAARAQLVRLRRAAATNQTLRTDDLVLAPDLSQGPANRHRAAVMEHVEIINLVNSALLAGTARVIVGGEPLSRVSLQWYEARDPSGLTQGVRTIGAGRKVYDFCTTDPKA